MLIGIDQMRAHMIFDNLGHEARHGTACAGDQVHDLIAPGLALECALYALHLASQSTHAGQQLFLFSNCVTHKSV